MGAAEGLGILVNMFPTEPPTIPKLLDCMLTKSGVFFLSATLLSICQVAPPFKVTWISPEESTIKIIPVFTIDMIRPKAPTEVGFHAVDGAVDIPFSTLQLLPPSDDFNNSPVFEDTRTILPTEVAEKRSDVLGHGILLDRI